MKTLNRVALSLGVALLLASVPTTSARADGPARAGNLTYCPLHLAGYWNGNYWYWCAICPPPPMSPYNAYRGDTVMHTCGLNCEDCPDPVTIAIARNGPEWPNTEIRQAKYMTPRRGGMGNSANPEFSFKRPTAILFSITRDEVLWVRGKGNIKRFFRVLLLTPTDLAKYTFKDKDGKMIEVRATPIGIGQELDPLGTYADAVEATIKHAPMTKRHLVLQSINNQGGTTWFVTTKEEFEK